MYVTYVNLKTLKQICELIIKVPICSYMTTCVFQNSTQIFNIYGITEVSCWATCHEVVALSSPPPCSLSSINSTDMVPIGDCLMGTDIELRDCVRTETGIEGTLWIGSMMYFSKCTCISRL